MSKSVTTSRVSNVRAHFRFKSGTIIPVRAHIRVTHREMAQITKAEYENAFSKRGAEGHDRDMKRLKTNAIPAKSSTAVVPKHWSTKKLDWEGVDGKKAKRKARR